MMKTFGFALLIALAATASFAQTPDDLVIAWEAIFDPATLDAPEVTLAAARRGGIATKDLCSAAARCDPYASISCSSAATGATCQGVDRNCAAGQPGFVRCDSAYTYCPPCGCTEGAYRYVAAGGCCQDDPSFKRQREQQCVNGAWVNTGFYDCFGRCGPIVP